MFSAVLFLLLPVHVRGSALTTTVGPNEKLCFYADVDKEGEKIGVSHVVWHYSTVISLTTFFSDSSILPYVLRLYRMNTFIGQSGG